MYLADMFTAGPNELDNIDNMARSFNQPLTTITHQTLVLGGHIAKMVNLNWRHQGHPPICRVFFKQFFPIDSTLAETNISPENRRFLLEAHHF